MRQAELFPSLPVIHTQHKQATCTGLTEILLPTTNKSRLSMLMPMLAHLSQNADSSKWFTWISPEGVDKALLLQHGFKLENLQLIHTSTQEEQQWILWETLRSRRSSVVVASGNGISKEQYKRLNSAAINGNTQGLVISYVAV